MKTDYKKLTEEELQEKIKEFKIRDYKKLTEEELQEKIKEFKIRTIQATRKMITPKEKPTSRSRLKKEIARIKTELNRRKILSNFVKTGEQNFGSKGL